jgi:hypothetical protein
VNSLGSNLEIHTLIDLAGEEIEAKVPLFFFRMVDAPGNPQGLYSELQAL